MNLLRKHNKIIKSIFTIVSSILVLLTIVFMLNKFSPIDPVLSVTGDNVSEEIYDNVYREMGLDKSFITQLFNYIARAGNFNFGKSFQTGNEVINDIKSVFPATIELATFAIVLSMFIGIPIGILSAYYKGRAFDHIMRIVTLCGSSMSVFWIGLLGLVIFYVTFGWSSGPGRLSNEFLQNYSDKGFIILPALLSNNLTLFVDAIKHIWLPAAVLAFVNMSYISRMIRSYILEQMEQEYVTICRAKGMSDIRILLVHCLPNIKIPAFTMLCISYAQLLEGSTLTETIYMWPGIGYYMTKSLLNNDTNAILGCTIILGIIFILTNFLVESINAKQKL